MDYHLSRKYIWNNELRCACLERFFTWSLKGTKLCITSDTANINICITKLNVKSNFKMERFESGLRMDRWMLLNNTSAQFKPSSVLELRHLETLNPNKATGLVNLPVKFRRNGTKHLAPLLTHIHFSIHHSRVPNEVKTAGVSPIYNQTLVIIDYYQY